MYTEHKLLIFDSWIQTMDERISNWTKTLKEYEKSRFDFSIDSLNEVENFLINKYKIEDLSNPINKTEIDACMTYVLKVFKINWPKSNFSIELEDKKNILFNRPSINLIPAIGMNFSPYQLLPSILNLKRIGSYRKVFDSKIKQVKESK